MLNGYKVIFSLNINAITSLKFYYYVKTVLTLIYFVHKLQKVN